MMNLLINVIIYLIVWKLLWLFLKKKEIKHIFEKNYTHISFREEIKGTAITICFNGKDIDNGPQRTDNSTDKAGTNGQ